MIYDKQVILGMFQTAQSYLHSVLPDEFKRKSNDMFVGTGKTIRCMREVGDVISSLALYSHSIRLPGTNKEREEFVKILVEESLTYDFERYMKCVMPVCPDYGNDEAFHSTINAGISREAEAALRAAYSIHTAFADVFLNVFFLILVADTETDHPDILQKCANGNAEHYLNICRKNAKLIGEKAMIPRVLVSTFTEAFGGEFTEKQHEYEQLLRQKMTESPKLSAEIQQISQKRRDRHAQILGRKEENYELTIRYMAQYAALGSLCRGNCAFIVNYPTPNKDFINAATYKGIILDHGEKQIIPVLESVLT